MMPWLAETSRRAAISSRVMTPGFTCGSSDVSFSTMRAHLAQVANGRFVAEVGQGLTRGAVTQFGFVAEREQSLGAAGGLTGPRDGQHFVG